MRDIFSLKWSYAREESCYLQYTNINDVKKIGNERIWNTSTSFKYFIIYSFMLVSSVTSLNDRRTGVRFVRAAEFLSLFHKETNYGARPAPSPMSTGDSGSKQGDA
jgi:hypothetical protein